ncbi:MAG: hypothetical protein IPG58_19845 [Acidobacteria bacterium]|nr:hypothetical protein [Acidobacteriota bacterium]
MPSWSLETVIGNVQKLSSEDPENHEIILSGLHFCEKAIKIYPKLKNKAQLDRFTSLQD